MSADKLLHRMEATKHGWKYNDVRKVYEGFGFQSREGGNHTLFSHPKHHHLRATVKRHRTLDAGYVDEAIKLIHELQLLDKSSGLANEGETGK